jgi:hypothetical protein
VALPVLRRRSADRQNTELIKGAEAAERLAALKDEDGGDITMSGSATLVHWLLREGLLDKLPSSQAFNTGVLNLSYGNCVLVERERLPDDRGRRRELERVIGRRRGSGRRRDGDQPDRHGPQCPVRGGEPMRAR